jgi:HEAT repeat protein
VGGVVNEHYHRLIENLAIAHRASDAYRALMHAGLSALPAVREGLRHESADVRYHCCRFLDHYLEPNSLVDLLCMLDDVDERVRISALHTMACDRCKQGPCRPDAARVLPRAIKLLAEDSSPHVRAMAVEVVGQFVHAVPQAEAAVSSAARSDPSAKVRKKAGWYAPGGTIYVRTASRALPARRRPRA